jgi:anaphase-promoting complex subunit 4
VGEVETKWCNTLDLAELTGHVDRSLGHILAVSCTDNNLRLISAFSGKTVHQLPTLPQSSNTKTSCLGWAINFTNSSATQRELNNSGDDVSLDDLLGLNVEIPTLLKSKANLPRELTLIDIETSLPKLSTLPATGGR